MDKHQIRTFMESSVAAQSQDEDVCTFALRHRRYERWFNLSEDDAFHYFRHGLRVNLRHRVIKDGAPTREAALISAMAQEEYEELLQEEESGKKALGVEKTLSTPSISEPASQQLSENMNFVLPSRPLQRCFLCGNVGHLKKDCALRLHQQQGRGRNRGIDRDDRGKGRGRRKSQSN
jgi:hypothetical protein